MKRFLVFVHSRYYPSGGMFDFEKDFDDLESALKFLSFYPDIRDPNFFILHHIYDTETKTFCEYELV